MRKFSFDFFDGRRRFLNQATIVQCKQQKSQFNRRQEENLSEDVTGRADELFRALSAMV